MLLIDVTIVNVALPDMAKDLGTSFSSLQWVVDGYALALAALVLGTGSIGDIVGHRRTYVGGLVLFALASLVCGLAPNDGVLIAARVVQGVGAAAMFATTFALLNASYQGRDRGTAYGMWGAVAGAAAAVGPILGGLLTQAISWRWIFFVNLPISVLAIVMCLWVFSNADHVPSGVRVDIPGMVTFVVSAGLITYGFIEASDKGWADAGTLAALLGGAAMLAVFVAVEARSDHAMLDLALLRNRSFVGILIAGLLLNFSAFGYLAYTSIWLQSVLGLSPIQSGLTGLPLSLAAFVVSAGTGKYLHGRAPGPIIAGGLVLIGLGGLISAVLVHGSASWPALMPGYLVVGVGVGFAMPTLSSSAMSSVAVQRGGMAAGALNTARQLGFAFGIALLGSVFAIRAQTTFSDAGVSGSGKLATALAGGQGPAILAKTPPAGRAALDHLLQAASVAGLRGAFVVAGVGAVLAGMAVFYLVRPARTASAAGPVPVGSGDPAPAR